MREGIIRLERYYFVLYDGALTLKISKMALNPSCNKTLHILIVAAEMSKNLYIPGCFTEEPSRAYCIKHLPDKNSGYFIRSFFCLWLSKW